MRKTTLVASLLLMAATAQGALAQGYGYPPPPPYGGPDYGPPPGYGPPPPPPGYGPPRGYGPPPGYGQRYGGGQVCAYENGFCSFNGYAVVRYGARGSYTSRQARDGIPCNNRVFGDPAPGIPKRCVID